MADKYEIKPYTPADMEQVHFDREGLAASLGKPCRETAELYATQGPSFTAYADGVPFAMAGVTILWPGTGEAWVIFGKEFRAHALFINRNVMKRLAQIATDHKLVRIQAVAEKDNPIATDWLFRLGFEYEGEMPFYWNRKTFLRFAKVYKENI